MKRRMPKQKPGRSNQTYATPLDFMAAVTARFGPMEVDLAGSEKNKKAPIVFTKKMDSLSLPLSGQSTPVPGFKPSWSWDALNWLNPPFGHIEPWAAKCERWLNAGPFLARRGRIFFLTPASVGSNWFRDHVYRKALVLFLCSNEHGSGRLSFAGEKDPYPKDCILSVFGATPGFELWGWRLPPRMIQKDLL
jgi:hypothetical protein